MMVQKMVIDIQSTWQDKDWKPAHQTWSQGAQQSQNESLSDTVGSRYDTRHPETLPAGDNRFAPKKMDGRVYVCDNPLCHSKNPFMKRSLPFDGQFVNPQDVHGHATDVLQRMYENREVDVTWLCSTCHQRPGEDLDATRTRIGAFDSKRMERTSSLVKRGFWRH